MLSSKRLWAVLGTVLGTVLVGTFLIPGVFGREVDRQAPPIPERVLTTDGVELATGEQILDGQQVWQSIGGQQIGSVWGHRAYQAPDWSADWLHRESVALLDIWAPRDHASAYDGPFGDAPEFDGLTVVPATDAREAITA